MTSKGWPRPLVALSAPVGFRGRFRPSEFSLFRKTNPVEKPTRKDLDGLRAFDSQTLELIVNSPYKSHPDTEEEAKRILLGRRPISACDFLAIPPAALPSLHCPDQAATEYGWGADACWRAVRAMARGENPTELGLPGQVAACSLIWVGARQVEP